MENENLNDNSVSAEALAAHDKIKIKEVEDKLAIKEKIAKRDFLYLYQIEEDESFPDTIRMEASKQLWEHAQSSLTFYNKELSKHRDIYFKFTQKESVERQAEKMAQMLTDKFDDKTAEMIIKLAKALKGID